MPEVTPASLRELAAQHPGDVISEVGMDGKGQRIYCHAPSHYAVAMTQAADLIDELTDSLIDHIAQSCTTHNTEDGSTYLDSSAISANADAMRLAARLGKIVIEDEAGRRVIGRWVEAKK